MSRSASGFGLFWWSLGSCVHKMFTKLIGKAKKLKREGFVIKNTS